jgi:hypothetical protein
MKTSIVAGSLLAALSLVAPLQAQRVAADVVLRSGPVAGRVVIADGYSSYRRPVVYRRAPARVIVVERVCRHQRHPDWRKQGYRQVVVYYRDGQFYDRAWQGAREVVVYERDGRYYRDCDDDHGRHDRYDRGDRDFDR